MNFIVAFASNVHCAIMIKYLINQCHPKGHKTQPDSDIVTCHVWPLHGHYSIYNVVIKSIDAVSV